MALSYKIQSDTTQVAFGGRPLLTGQVVEITIGAQGDYTLGTGIALTAAQAGLSSIFHATGYLKSSTGVAKGFLPVWDPTLGAFRIFATGAANQGAFSEIATGGAALAAGDIIVAYVLGF